MEETKQDTSTAVVNTAPIKWAQRTDLVYVTFVIDEAKDESISFTETTLTFRGTDKHGRYYEHEIELYQPILPDKSSWKVHPFGVEMVLKKNAQKRNDGQEGFWPRLLKDEHHGLDVTIDWNHWVEEDGEIDDEDPFRWYNY